MVSFVVIKLALYIKYVSKILTKCLTKAFGARIYIICACVALYQPFMSYCAFLYLKIYGT